MNTPSSQFGFIAPEPSDLAPHFPAYEIHDLIATGGMGAVYRAVQKSLDRTVALKILPLEFSEDAEFCAGFEAEAKAMARLNHPNLIAVYDFGEVNGMLFIVMEFVPGKSIYHSAHGQVIDPRDVIRLVTGICNGLAHAHENGILHRDIKPSNILLTPQAEPKIGDFGLARPVERKTRAGEVIFGTPGYTAPEVVNAPETVDHRADLFSVGVLLHELLTGKLPADDPRPASVISGCDVRFDAIIRRATSPLPESRYSNAAEISGELHKIMTAPVTTRMAVVRGAPKGGPARPPIPRRATAAGVKRKSLNLTWVGPLVAVAIMVYSWHHFANMKPRVVIIDDPASNSSPADNSGSESERGKDPDQSQTLLDSTPSKQKSPPLDSNAREMSTPEVRSPTEVKEPVATVLDATDLTSLRGKTNQQVAVQGRVLKTSASASGKTRYLNFTEDRKDSLTIALPAGAQPMSELQKYVGKWIQFSGIVEADTMGMTVTIDSLSELRVLEGVHDSGTIPTTTLPAREARSTPPGVPREASYFNEKWYLVYLEPGTWKSAKTKCLERRGQMAVIRDAPTQDFLKNLTMAKRAWIGASDEAREGQWRWSDGTEIGFKAFGPNEPDSRGDSEDYLFMAQGVWCDTSANDASIQSFVCEWPDKPAESAATTGLSAESSELEIWKKKTFEEFPDLNREDSELARRVKTLKEKKELLTPSFFRNPQWPYLLAQEASLAMQQDAKARNRNRFPAEAKSFNGKRYLVYETSAPGKAPETDARTRVADWW